MYDLNKEKVSKRYSSAIYNFAKERDILDETIKCLEMINIQFCNDNVFHDLLLNPLLNFVDKRKVILEKFDIPNENIKNIIFYLLKKDRLDCLPEIYYDILQLSYKDNGSISVVATFTKNLSNEQIDRLIKKLEKKYNKKIVLTLEKNEDIIGGGIIKIGSNIIDGSLKYQIEAMKRKF